MGEINYTKFIEELQGGIDEGHAEKKVTVNGVSTEDYIARLMAEFTSSGRSIPEDLTQQMDASKAYLSSGDHGSLSQAARGWLTNKRTLIVRDGEFPDEQTKKSVIDAAIEGLVNKDGVPEEEAKNLVRELLGNLTVQKRT